MSNDAILQIKVSLAGRTMRTYNFPAEQVSIGRDPGADLFLDNPGVSREHARFQRTPQGYFIEDLQSANGTFLNDRQIKRELLHEGDVIRIGKFSLTVALKQDQRNVLQQTFRNVSPDVEHGTTVLSRDQLARVFDSVKRAELAPPMAESESMALGSGQVAWRSTPVVIAMLISLLIGFVMGSGLTWMFIR